MVPAWMQALINQGTVGGTPVPTPSDVGPLTGTPAMPASGATPDDQAFWGDHTGTGLMPWERAVGQMFGGGEASAGGAAPTPGDPNFGVTPVPDIPFPTGGGGSVQRFNPEAMPYREARTVDPSLASREAYAGDRLGRIEQLVRGNMDRQTPSPWEQNVWRRLLAIAGPLSSAPSGEMGNVGARTLAGWNETHDARLDRRLRMELGLEDERGRSAEAGFARESGEHTARERTQDDRFAVDTTNVGQENQAGQQFTGDQNRASLSAADNALRLSIAQFEHQNAQRDRALGFILPQGGPASLRAFGQEAGRLGPEVAGPAMETQARRGLEALITNEAALAGGNAQRQGNRVHQTMERIAGGAIPRPPRQRGDTLSAAALARHYSRYVPLDNSEVMNEFPGFAAAE